MTLAQVTPAIRAPDSWPGNSIWSPAFVWLDNKIVPPIPRRWGGFLKRIAGYQPEKSQMAFYLSDPRGQGRDHAALGRPSYVRLLPLGVIKCSM